MTLQPALTTEDLTREGVVPAGPGRNIGTIDFTTDEDYFLFAPQQNRSYTLRVDSAADMMLGIYPAPGLTLLLEDDDSGQGVNPEISFTTGATPVLVLIQVDALASGEPGDPITAGVGDYFLDIFDGGQTEPLPPIGTDIIGDTAATAGAITIGNPITEAIETGGDIDRYTVFLEEGQRYRAELDGTALGNLGAIDAFLELISPANAVIAENDDAGPDTLDAALDFTAPSTGFFALQVSDFDLNAGTGGYTLNIFEVGPPPQADGDAVGDIIDTAALAEVTQPVVNRIDRPNDFDVFEFALIEDNTYRIDALGLSGFDPQLALLDFQGREIAFNDDRAPGDRDAEITFTPGETGFFFVEVGSADGRTGDYDLLVDILDSKAATTSEAQTVALLFEAGLGRQAAFAGLNFWIDSFEIDGNMTRIAEAFLLSPEFSQRVGDPFTLSDGDFVDGLFVNVIGRPPAQEGFVFWTDQLAQGATRAETLLAFAIAEENVAFSPNVLDIVPVGDQDDGFAFLVDDASPEWDFLG